MHAAYVGHPLAHAISDLHASDDARDAARAELGLDGGTVVALLPGSRASEVSLVGPSLFGAAEILTRDADVHVVVPCLRAALRAPIEALARQLPAGQVHIADGDARRALTACDAALVKSGTSTLEAMCLARPMVVSYRLGDWSYRLARRLVRTPFIALPNILAGEALVPELLQHDATPAALAEALQAVLHRARTDDTYLDTFRALHAQLRVGDREGSEAARVVHRLACSRQSRG